MGSIPQKKKKKKKNIKKERGRVIYVREYRATMEEEIIT